MGKKGLEGVVEAAVPLVPVVATGAGMEFISEMAIFEEGCELAVGRLQAFLIAAC